MAGEAGAKPGSSEGASRVVVRAPPKSELLIGVGAPIGGARIVIWELWLDLAERHAAFASAARVWRPEADCHVDLEEPLVAGSSEFDHAMLAISAAAFAIDGLYGAVKPFIGAPPCRARRSRRILETLKHGFAIGNVAREWGLELDWLFDLRHSLVHHAERYEPLEVVHQAEGLVVVMPVTLSEFGCDTAVRAARLAREIIDTCRSNPKAQTIEWVQGRATWGPGSRQMIRPGDIESRTFRIGDRVQRESKQT